MATGIALDWLPYQRSLVDFLKRTDPEVWNWFAKSATDSKVADDVRLELLKSTYRVDRGTQLTLYEVAEEVANYFGISAPITIYQAQNPQGINASLAFVPGDVHLILHGAVATQLTTAEVRALFGHELAHYVLWQADGNELLIAFEMLRALLNDAHAHPAHFASMRLLQLYNEIYCDRGSYLVTRDVHTVIGMLVKVLTGVQEVSAQGYLQQAEEVFSKGPSATKELTHPESFIRAWAIKLFGEDQPDANEQIAQMIEGVPGLDELDLVSQVEVALSTRRVLDALLWRKWFQTDLTLAHARLYFDDYGPPSDQPAEGELARHVRVEPTSVRDYYCFVLLDMASADRELDEAPLAVALVVSEQLGVKPRFVELARQELRLRKAQLEKSDQQRDTILAAAHQEIAR